MAGSAAGRGVALMFGLGLGVLAAVAPAWAQQMSPEEEQRCVWQCLANSPGADSRQYNDCVERMCVAPQAAQPRAAAPAPKAAWTAGGRPGTAQYAGVEIPGGRSLSFLCQVGGHGLLAIAGMGRSAEDVGVAIDGRGVALPFVAEKGILYTAASAPLLRSLMAGGGAQVRTRAGTASFPLAGSGAAIRQAASACGMKL
ncbi:hypothetical protein [Amaricoccus sp.]|uniref:hypothetical protein n=1 Tax=Amaricoccus sp. TaxID=1872485 RepID=UPI001B5AB95C|nr:hypothetical protein [Amaricoccus sp.]MBP7000455.1 hypothetical protein [Amaricoccus sp.]